MVEDKSKLDLRGCMKEAKEADFEDIEFAMAEAGELTLNFTRSGPQAPFAYLREK